MTEAGEATPTPANTTDNNTSNGEEAANGNDAPRRRPFNTNRKPAGPPNTFKGETSKMNGNVFQVHSERKNKSQFTETVEALGVYASSAYKSDIEYLMVLFTKLENPTVFKLEDPVEDTKVVDGEDVTFISKFEEMKYTEKVKQWIRDDKSLKATIRSLYYIVMGQCSKLMRNKLAMSKDYVRFEAEGDVAALLKEIRRISLQIETNTSAYDALDEAKILFYTYKQE